MKITVLDQTPGEEDEIILKCGFLDEDMMKFINSFKTGRKKLYLYKNEKIVLVDYSSIIYFESVDDNVFAYTENEVFETKSRLYQLETDLPAEDFMRANKAVILNLNKIESLSAAFGGRFEATMNGGYKVIISRMYVATLKKKLEL